jgi:tetratricopeptide (TPR) repeat protein
MATGALPFRGASSGLVMEAILNRAPAPAMRLNPKLPGHLEQIINKCLEKDRNLRYQHASEIRADLQRLKRDSESGHLEVSVEQRTKFRLGYMHRRGWQVLVPSLLTVVVIAAGAYFYLRRSPVLTEKDTIVLADFTNNTGDPVFDSALRQRLAVELEQSPFLRLVAGQQIQQTLRMMNRPSDAKLTLEIASQVCVRTGSAAVLDSSISQIGSEYSLILKAVNCSTGESLASTEAQAKDKNHVLTALSQAAATIRRKLGESQSTLQRFNTPLQQATTPSLEALNAYSMGDQLFWGKGEHAKAIPFFQEAISLDPHFAMAYAVLGTAYGVLDNDRLSVENTRKAYTLRNAVSEPERFYIESHYYDTVTKDGEKAREVYELWAQTYPRDPGPRNNLGVLYCGLGEYDECASNYDEALRLDPNSAVAYFNVFDASVSLGRMEVAKKIYEEASSKRLDSPVLHGFRYQLAFLENDAKEMQIQLAWARGKPGVEANFLNLEAETAAYFGEMQKFRQLSQSAINSAQSAEQTERAAKYEADAAIREALVGNAVEARQRANTSLRVSSGPNVQYAAALALALAGDTTHAEKLGSD